MGKMEFISLIFSRKSSIAAIGIIALCFIATIVPGQVALDENAGVNIVPVPAAAENEYQIDWKYPAGITLITCLAIVVQGLLDYFRPRNKKYVDVNLGSGVDVELKPPALKNRTEAENRNY